MILFNRNKLFAILTILLLLPMAGSGVTGAFARSPSSNTEKVTLYGTSAPVPQSSGTPMAKIDQNLSTEIPPPSQSQIDRLIPHSGLQAVRTSADHIPTTPGSEVSFASAATGFNGLNLFDERNAGTGLYANTQFTLEPPDQGLCVSTGFVLEQVNTAFIVYDTSGNPLTSPTAFNQFFGLTPSIIRHSPLVFGAFASDPKCYFDSSTNRWFMSLLEIDTDPSTGAFGTTSNQLIAVSQTSDPTGQWYLYSVPTQDDGTDGTPAHPGCPCFGDQPLIGADANGFYVTTNEFSIAGPQFNGAQIYAFSKSQLESGSISTVEHLEGGTYPGPLGGPTYSLQPATVPPGGTFASDTEYFMGALQFVGPTDNRIAVWALTGTDSLSTSTPSLSLSYVVISSEVYGQPPAAVQQNGPTPTSTLTKPQGKLEFLNTNDDRMNQVVYADGYLFSGLNTVVKTANFPVTSGIAYFIVSPSVSENAVSASIHAQGYVAYNGGDVMFPSIGVNNLGDGVMTFTLSGPTFFPSAAYVTVTPDGTGPIHIAAVGAAPEDGFTGYAAFGGSGRVVRWGDYSAAVMAPTGKIWFATEYISGGPRTAVANWATFVANISP